MPDQLPDVLQNAGVTPHEVGWLQLHAEPVVRAGDGRAVAELWLQAAFHPPGSGRVELVDAATGASLVEVPLPAVGNGSAVRWRIPFQLPAGTTVVRFQVEAGVPDKAVRIRTPWKLLDTIELRLPDEDPATGLELTGQLSEMASDVVKSPGRLIQDAAREVVHVLHVAGVAEVPRPLFAQQQRPSGMKVHPPRAARREIVSFVLPAKDEEQFAPAIETLWMNGEPLDGEALRKRVRALPPSAGPTCPNCDAPLVPGGEFCPRCLGPVPGAQPPPLDVPVSMLPPLSAMAPHLKSSEEEVARCHVHPDRASIGRCTRCGNAFCEDCASTDTAGVCAKCTAEELNRAKAVVLAPQIYRDASLVHLALFFFLVLRPFIGVVLEYRQVFTVVDALPFGGLGILLFGMRKPLTLLAALGVDLLVLADAYAIDDYSRIIMALAAAALTTMLWLRLPDPDALPEV